MNLQMTDARRAILAVVAESDGAWSYRLIDLKLGEWVAKLDEPLPDEMRTLEREGLIARVDLGDSTFGWRITDLGLHRLKQEDS